jgi:hypothetical protein
LSTVETPNPSMTAARLPPGALLAEGRSQPTATASLRQRLRWLRPAGVVAAVFAVLLALFGGIALRAMRAAPPALRFFDPRRSPTFDETCVVSTMDYALSSTEPNDVIFIGDSACRTGLDPVRFEKLTGIHSYNLGIVGDLGPGVMLSVANAYLSAHPSPRLVVLCLSPVGLERDVPRHWLKLKDHVVNCYGFDVHSVESLQGSVGYAVRQGTVLAWDSAASSFTDSPRDVRDRSLIGMEQVTYRQFEHQSREKRGHFDLPGRGPAKDLDRPGGTVVVHESWDAGVRRLARNCARSGVPLLIRFCPVSAEATKTLNFERPVSWLNDLQASFPHLLLATDQNVLRYGPELCWDYSHVNPHGARQFTDQVAADVRLALAQKPE